MESNSGIDAKIVAAAPFARPILTHLRALVHQAIPGAGEAIKWGMPHFTYKGKNIAAMASFKAHCAFSIHGESQEGKGMGTVGKIGSLADLPDDVELTPRRRSSTGSRRRTATNTSSGSPKRNATRRAPSASAGRWSGSPRASGAIGNTSAEAQRTTAR